MVQFSIRQMLLAVAVVAALSAIIALVVANRLIEAIRLALATGVFVAIICSLARRRCLALLFATMTGAGLLLVQAVGPLYDFHSRSGRTLVVRVFDEYSGCPIAGAAVTVSVNSGKEDNSLYWNCVDAAVDGVTDHYGLVSLKASFPTSQRDSLLGRDTVVWIPETYALSVCADDYIPTECSLSKLAGKSTLFLTDGFLKDRPLQIGLMERRHRLKEKE